MSHPLVFVIDDDVSVRKSLERLIRSAGWNVHGFGSAEEFLNSLSPPPDCLILDVRMPGMSGLELQERLIADNRRLPIVFISAHDDELARRTALSAGASGFLQKPFEDHVLLQAISRAITQHVT